MRLPANKLAPVQDSEMNVKGPRTSELGSLLTTSWERLERQGQGSSSRAEADLGELSWEGGSWSVLIQHMLLLRNHSEVSPNYRNV